MIKMETQDDILMIQKIMKGDLDNISVCEKYPIMLENILFETRKGIKNKEAKTVILLEGGPGCGKSTLSVHISQQWGEGKLLMEFKYVILVHLRDPAVQAAKCIADLLPARDDDMSNQAAKVITDSYGDGILFILDGWDELPPKLDKSIFHGIIQSDKLSKSTVIVTSRPIASVDLRKYASSRIEILGFTIKELTEYFTDCLKGNTEAVDALFERIHENPAIAGRCYLPMTASILVHLFIDGNNTLPTTLYGIFSELILSCIYRHRKERTTVKDLTLKSLHQIPEEIKEPFLFLCKLAYQGIMDDRFVFSDLPPYINTLGLLQGVKSTIGYRKEKKISYNFLHLSIQELLAGFYIATQLPENEQASKFNELLYNLRFSAVFQFYAAITKLQTPGIKDVVIRTAIECGRNMRPYIYQPLLLSLLHCLYEAQQSTLYESVAQ